MSDEEPQYKLTPKGALVAEFGEVAGQAAWECLQRFCNEELNRTSQRGIFDGGGVVIAVQKQSEDQQ